MKQKKNGQQNETKVFKILDITERRTLIPERWKTNEVSLTIALSSCHERVSR